MRDFQQLWALLYDHGASGKKEEGTRRFWVTLSATQQEQAFRTISKRLQEGKFVQYDPIRAIRESLRNRMPTAQPTFLRGDEKGLDIVQVFYEGRYKLCSRETMEQFGLQFVREW